MDLELSSGCRCSTPSCGVLGRQVCWEACPSLGAGVTQRLQGKYLGSCFEYSPRASLTQGSSRPALGVIRGERAQECPRGHTGGKGAGPQGHRGGRAWECPRGHTGERAQALRDTRGKGHRSVPGVCPAGVHKPKLRGGTWPSTHSVQRGPLGCVLFQSPSKSWSVPG